MASEPRRTSPSDVEGRYLESPAATSNTQLATTTPGLHSNPFESHVMSTLHLPTFSPSVFAPPTATPESQKQIPKPFRWDIETLAEVKPADIEEPVDPRQCTESYDMTQEEHIQRTISTFFSADLVAPSPLNQPAPAYNLLAACPTGECLQDCLHNFKGPTRTVGCQTNLTLPPTLDIEKLLSQHMMSDAELDEMASTRRSSSGDSSLSASSLRRKLFHCNNASSSDEDGGCEAAAAVLAAAIMPGVRIEQSPMQLSSQKSHWGRAAMTPNVACSPMVLCSSNMTGSSSGLRPVTRQRTCSFNSEEMASPEMSPIDASRTPGHGPTIHVRAAHNGRMGTTPATVASAKAAAAAGAAAGRGGFSSPMSTKPPSRRQAFTSGGGSASGKPGLAFATTTVGFHRGDVAAYGGGRQDVTLVGSDNDDDGGRHVAIGLPHARSAGTAGDLIRTPRRGDMGYGGNVSALQASSQDSLLAGGAAFAPQFAFPAPSSSNGAGGHHHHHQHAAWETHMSTANGTDPSTSCCSASGGVVGSTGDNPNITWHPSSYSTPQKADGHSAGAAKPFKQ